jgi:prefoldin subunit 5
MGFTFEEFPDADYYRSDLRAVLRYVREISNYIKNYDEVIAELQEQLISIQGLYTRVDNIESAISDLDSIRAELSTLFSDVQTLNNRDVALQTQIDSLKNRLDNINTQFNEVYKYIDVSIASVDTKWYRKWLQLQKLVNTSYLTLLYLFDDLESKFNDVLENLSSDVFNPIKHKRMTFDENNKQAYVDLRDDGMTYGELAARQFTYGYIRDAKWRNRLFSTKGRRYVTHSDVNLFSPISGRYTNWAEALSQAVGFIFQTINYGQLAEQEITYAQMESLTYGNLIRVSDREPLDYETLENLTINGTNILAF